MSVTTGLNFEVRGIGTVLKDRYLRVPKFQRSYAWDKGQVDDLLSDLGDAVGKEPEYFLGTLVFAKGTDGTFEVIDGQQRLGTVSILLASIRDFLRKNEDDRFQSIETEFLHTRERRSQELRAKLHLNAKDHNFYRNNIIDSKNSHDNFTNLPRESHTRLLQAKNLCRKHVESLAQGTRDASSRLLDWVDFIEVQLKIVVIDVPDDANAFMIFETLNDRGADLSIADLLKNYLFGRAADRLNEVEDAWNTMLGALEGVGGESLVLTYIRHLWSSMYGATREKNLYGEIKKKKRTKRDVVDFAEDLALHATFYAAIASPQIDFWTSYGGDARESMLALKQLRLEQFRPLVLAVLSEFPEREVPKLLKYLVACSVRFLITGRLGGGTMENIYSGIALKVRRHEIRTTLDFASAINEHLPRDAEFANAFSEIRVSKAYLARYYLQALERASLGESDPELIPNQNEQQVNLEHVLPRNPSENWKLSDSDRVAANYKRLGNLCLLKQRINSEIGNLGFDAKKPALEASSFKLTSEIALENDWTDAEIMNRQKRLAAIALKAWRNDP